MFKEERAHASPLMGICHGKRHLGMRGGLTVLMDAKIAAHAYNVLLRPFPQRRDEGHIPGEVQFGKVAQLFVAQALFGLEKTKINGTATQALEECQQALLVVGPDRPDMDRPTIAQECVRGIVTCFCHTHIDSSLSSVARGSPRSHNSQKIRLHDVLLHHALRIEKRAIERDGVTHDTEEVLLVAIEQRQDDLLEFVIERRCILGTVIVYVQATVISPNRPSRNPFDAAFQPPAIQHTQRGHPVECGFHAARTGGFERWLWGVEPDIDTSSEYGP